MKKILLSLSLVLVGVSSQAQNLLSQNFDVFPAVAAPGTDTQWVQTNQSAPLGAATWAQGGGTAFAGGAQAGGATSFTLCNYTSTTGVGTISNWLIAPVVDLKDGDIISFWARQGGTAALQFADRLQMRIATDWSGFSALPTSGAEDVGSFTLVATDINPNLAAAGFPLVWTNYTYTVTGLPTATPCRIAFRYFVTNGGPDGANSNIIGLDTFSVDRALATEGFFTQNFAVYPNPASDVLNINAKNNTAIKEIQLTDVNGRTVKTVKANETTSQVNISDLNAGVYFLKVTSDLGTGTTKVVKN